jgi:hypothetical protein
VKTLGDNPENEELLTKLTADKHKTVRLAAQEALANMQKLKNKK